MSAVKVITISTDELRDIIDGAVAKALANGGQAANDHEYLTTEEAAKVLRCTRRNVLNLIDDGLPCRKVGREYRFRRVELMAWIEGNKG